ncbi:molybdenum ABC transporter ATP-binding protein [Mycolicibacterium duvalii]|uniref:Molybdenum ABC transporter ATP-binding protein n=1 Tax=Mycolicibacterium duvalii TaxID=39688 RepID=A0A7I7JYU8_9MYCO|nr:ATP-binding cassette domain-containing protein [Mycolicibacterium duvalii]MCV7368684.1 ATP-binding cassette domain-containing protein [Mycolicibacterium duvalii]PEG35617.1 molybdenum ABC transporter ATP-binding protein [Mycolicibacterium duvalii]BBX16943.1 molybdenum ABC transporter ATP-binding protein [Mycolicibacterium duvalii]
MSALHVRAGVARRGLDVDVTVGDGEVLAVLGPNGAGKSTLLQVISGLLRPDWGRVTLGSEVLTDTATRTFVPVHARGVATLSQQPLLFPHMTVLRNVEYGPRCAGQSRRAASQAARGWLDEVGAAELAARRPDQLSGGQAQRVALARALATEPTLLLLDEPLAALDVTGAPALRRLLRRVLRDQRRTAVIVTHDVVDALAIADSAVVIDGGAVVESGPVRRVLTVPRSDFAARMAGVNLIAGTVTAPGRITTAWNLALSGRGQEETGVSAVALFSPSAVAVHLDRPTGSPRNVFPVTISDIDVRGNVVRVRGGEQPDGGTGPAADITAAAAADLDLHPGQTVYFAVKTQEVELHRTDSQVRPGLDSGSRDSV